MLIHTASPARCLETLLAKRAWRQRWQRRLPAATLKPDAPVAPSNALPAAAAHRRPKAHWTSLPQPRPRPVRPSRWQTHLRTLPGAPHAPL